jgi:hypothetical protein
MEINFKTTKSNSKKYEYQDHKWVLDNQINVEDIVKLPEFGKFEYCGSIIKSNSAAGYEISLVEKFKGKSFIIYVATMGGKVLKGGKSKNPLDTRSYSAGTEESWTMRGTPSVTNYVWSQIFRESLRVGCEVKFYGMVVPSYEMTYESFDGEVITESVSPYESEEKKLNHLLNKLNGKKVIGEGKLLEPLKK